MSMEIISLALFTFSITRITSAAPICFDRGLRQFDSIVELAAEIEDSPTRRQEVPDYAQSNGLSKEQAAKIFAATGVLKCKGSTGSGNLVVKNDLVLASGHSLVDYETCEVRSTASDCTFQVEGQEPVRVARTLYNGDKCPQKGAPDGDWVVLKLEKPIEGVVPYKVKPMGDRDTFELQNVVAVGAQSRDFQRRDPKTKQMVHPKHVQNCAITRIFYRYYPYMLGAKCDWSYGSSGGALLSSDLSEPTIVGIITGFNLTPEEHNREMQTKRSIRKKYNEDDFYGGGMAIFGSLSDALAKAAQ